jgi:superfamily II DNA or RNA helicase
MNEWHPFADSIQLHVQDRISETDSRRQERTAQEILRRLADQPGLVLADEVGMGKTFVALAVAASVALSDAQRRPVVVMVPPSLKQKWPRDFSVFAEKCLSAEARQRVRAASADSAVAFLKLLDDPEERRNSIIFLTHGAMHRGLSDAWVKLAVIQRALRGRHHTEQLRRTLSRCAGKLLRLGWVERHCEDIWERLLDAQPESWLKILRRFGIDPEGNGSLGSDDPVPRAVVEALRGLDVTEVYAMLQGLPQRHSTAYEKRITEARQLLTDELKEVWRRCLTQLEFRLPLLVMDEAHHLKNPEARLSGLFQNPDAKNDAEEISRGALGGIFERMLFLTATPFQLGHHELCSVLERFEGIAWDSTDAPRCGREAFRRQVREVRERLDAAQMSALSLDAYWGQLRAEDLVADGQAFSVAEVESWWAAVSTAPFAAGRTPAAEGVLNACQRTSERMRAAESVLRPWVIRHLKDRCFNGVPRRQRLAGRAIHRDNADGDERGIDVGSEALLPFLLAARATACMPEARPVFAEGLASSYEAFLHTRKAGAQSIDGDDDDRPTAETGDAAAHWYLERLEEALPLNDHHASAGHPKIAATAKRVLELWRRGEKVVVFCHYVQTGRVLRQVISELMMEEIYRAGAEKLGCALNEVEAELERLGKRFFDADSPARRACDAQVAVALARHPKLAPHTAELQEVTRRYLRTPSFMVRFFPLSLGRLHEGAVKIAFASSDGSGLSLHDVLEEFFAFLADRCIENERADYLAAIRSIQTGTIIGRDAQDAFAADERQGAGPERLLANVRLVNGAVKSDTRQRLMLTFNSPFFPEVLIASSVMAEGVDLHRFCRYVIHHDLSWNPSTLEQRTGRVDRIGAKVERCGQPIRVYLPYLAETQDEKQYRVVMDRERWFSVVMGEKFNVDARNTEKLAQRVPLPAALVRELTLRLSALNFHNLTAQDPFDSRMALL